MLNWAKEVIVATEPYHKGTGFITSNGHIVGFRLIETTRSAGKSKGGKMRKVEIAFLPMNTAKKPERPDKRALLDLLDQLNLRHSFIEVCPKRLGYSMSNGNEIIYFEDLEGEFYNRVVNAAYELDQEGSWGNNLLHADAYNDNPFELSAITKVEKHGLRYTLIGEKGKIYVAQLEVNGSELEFNSVCLDGTCAFKINVTADFIHRALDKIHVKGSPNVELEVTDRGAFISGKENKDFNAAILKRLEKAYIQSAGLILTPGQQMARDVRRAKHESNPFAALKNLSIKA